ncbi:restriction endonuclease subunit S [Streptococcus equi]|uniref:restriction endonuclease subunit S n=1 Tax=Streptococcus equi TaxID=1336 RepID=UPI0013F5B150|nr:restriction endonuclease subunit S [Streptococcus equi]MCD3391783.1 restriction endonuclease subunit S [Streptococcus equi subsp. zooepidemicus]MCD3461243.1 restriction endonuclease subunit S [Streptococcus equi subsp. zooepidemicus]HEK9980653.1 restriction endonuclease subunit S [Streptococcus equi subsp. zooepidemicus]HEL0766255.1 restriction endonuclease subunit S [Streptococcus equi subsp. zooepidemicus]HEL0789079.1 restriction endonuclease subunit S [Streptococcus equi subsp. zooepidem
MASVEWGEYQVGDLFDIVNTPSFNKERLTAGDEYDYVTRTSLNQGILQGTGFVNESNLNEANVWSLGLLQMDFFYRKRKWYAGQFVRKIIPKFETTANNAKFFSVMLNKLKPVLLQVLVRNVDDTFKNQLLNLPTQNNQIDFDFMESFIAELEVERIAELSAYLKVSGLDNYELSIEEQNALRAYDSMEWGEYRLEDLFGKSTRGKRLKSLDRISGKLPFVTAGEANTGISAYIGNDVKIFQANTTTIDMFGSAKYRNYNYGADDHIAVVHTENLSKFASLFITATIERASHTGKFSYDRNFYAKDADELVIALPKDGIGNIDYTFMENYASALQKLVIKDVVQYTDKRIEATKTVVAEHQKEESE